MESQSPRLQRFRSMTLCWKFKVDLSHGDIEIRELGEFRFAGKSSENHFFWHECLHYVPNPRQSNVLS